MVVLFSLTSMLLSMLAMYSYSVELKLALLWMTWMSAAVAITFFISSFIEKDTVIPKEPERKIPLRDASGKFIKRK